MQRIRPNSRPDETATESLSRKNNRASPAPLREISVDEVLIEADELLERARLLDATREYLRGFKRRGEQPAVQRQWVDGVERYDLVDPIPSER